MNLKDFLDIQVEKFNTTEFITNDPISVPHRFNKKEDIEVTAFFTALLSWGRRDLIISNALHLFHLMDNDPYNFILSSAKSEIQMLLKFYYRTFNGIDLQFYLEGLKCIYQEKSGLETIVKNGFDNHESVKGAIIHLRNELFAVPHLKRSEKHFGNPAKGSAAKRINMFLRWMVRKDEKGVDFGIWPKIPMSKLMCPLDVHSGNTARKLGLLTRKYNDWRAVEELTKNLRLLDTDDPVKYDYALFGTGISEPDMLPAFR